MPRHPALGWEDSEACDFQHPHNGPWLGDALCHFPTLPTGESGAHLPNKLLSLESLSQFCIWGPKLSQGKNFSAIPATDGVVTSKLMTKILENSRCLGGSSLTFS